MESLFKFALSALVGVCGLVGTHSSAFGVTIQPANVCESMYGHPGLARNAKGISNGNTQSNIAVTCPVIRVAGSPASGFSVWVDGWLATSGGGQCGLYSYNWDGTFMGMSTQFINGSGLFSLLFTLPASQVPTFSSVSAWCVLTPGSWLYDIEPVQ